MQLSRHVGHNGISLYLQGTLSDYSFCGLWFRYIPVPTGNSAIIPFSPDNFSVYPCTYRELASKNISSQNFLGISLYLQGTRKKESDMNFNERYIPVPTGNSYCFCRNFGRDAVYPCTYRELNSTRTF